MKKTYKKAACFTALLMAFAMLMAVALPSVNTVLAQTADGPTDVVIHKVVMDSLAGWPKGDGEGETGAGAVAGDGQVTSNGIHYTGQDLGTGFGTYFGTGAEELAGVTFTYWNVTEAQYNTMMANPADYDTATKAGAYLTTAGTVTAPTSTTDPTGVRVANLANGYYWFVENMGSYAGPNGETLNDSAAVPFGLSLPLQKADGTYFGTGGNALHVYPKNTTEAPEIDKDFLGEADPANPPPAGPKPVAPHQVGDVIQYEIKTNIPANTNYATAKWSDRMTDGLTFNNDVKVFIGTWDATATPAAYVYGTEIAATNYTYTPTANGFDLSLTAAGLELINKKDPGVQVWITYSATLNEDAVADIPESNDVVFNYGNNPDHGNAPVPVYPENGQIVVDKTWANSDGTVMTWPAGVTVTVKLVNAQTGADATQFLQDGEPGYDAAWSATKTLTAANPTATWTGLDNTIQYKVVEVSIAGYSTEHISNANGVTTLKNWKDDNPPPLNPEEPRVVTYGKKFVKTDDTAAKNRLIGAEFAIKNAEGQFLALKDPAQRTTEQAAYVAADAAYRDYIAGITGTPTTEQEAQIATLKATRDTAYAAMNMEWTWIADDADPTTIAPAGAYILISNADGQFEISGLNAGTYHLVEVKAPVGFATIPPQEFIVGAGTYNTGNIPYTTEGTANNAQQVINKKVTIPQTGGIGSIIFVVGGFALMGAALAMMRRKNQAQ